MALQWPAQGELPVLVEILLNGVWTDITRYVYLRDGITITGGAPDESSKPQPGTLTLTLNNRDGRFSPRYTSGAYYPYLDRNTQIRLSVDVATSAGARYSGFRFWGEVPDWPPSWDLSGRDVYVQVTASGPLRRVNQGGGQGSALVRYYASLNATYRPIAYWPCEEDPQVSQIQTGQPGGNVMTITGSPQWKAVSAFNGSAPIGVLNGSTWDGLTGQVAWSGDDIYSTPGDRSWTCPPGITTVNCRVWGPGDNGVASGGAGGGGGEFAQETALAVTPGKDYPFRVRAGGSQTPQTFTGDSVTVTANNGYLTTGGTGSTNTTHRNGGAGGTGNGSAGGGGGGAGGGTSAGGAGGNASGTTGGAGGTAGGTGAGAGGAGGNGGIGSAGYSGAVPGGGGGGGGTGTIIRAGSGGNGGPGEVRFTYTPPAAPLANVLRFILFVPAHGGNNGKVLARMLTGGTIARLDVIYSAVATVPKLQLKGYDSGNNLKFDSGAQTFPLLGLTFMVSAELTTSGSSVAWKLTGIVPGADDVFATYTGTVATASLGNVTEVIVAPNADITKTAMGHFSVQYAVVPLQKVSMALHGHHTEMGIDRFLRLANEQALDAEPGWNETKDHWGFEGWTFTVSGTPGDKTYFIIFASETEIQVGDKFTASNNPGQTFTVTDISAAFAGFRNVRFYPDAGTIISNPATVTTTPAPGVQGWTGSNGSVAQSPVFVANDDLSQLNSPPNKWPSHGTHSLLLTATGGAGAWSASSPSGTSGQPILPGDRASVHADIYTPAALGAVRPKISWYNGAGTLLSTTSGTARATTAGQVTTLKLVGTAPASTATFNVTVEDNETKTAGTLLYIDNVRVHPRMGPQTRRELKHFLQEIRELDQGIIRESRKFLGVGYRTRVSLLNQTPKLTLDYSAGQVSPPLQPVADDLHTKNHITIHRHKGGKVTVSADSGSMSTASPPDGVGLYKKWLRVIAEADEQIYALASHLLALGTWNGERYPTVTVNLIRPQMAALLPTAAEVEIGDYVQITNLPFFTPAATAKQIVTGYTETMNAYEWVITWNCQPESPLEITSSLRRW